MKKTIIETANNAAVVFSVDPSLLTDRQLNKRAARYLEVSALIRDLTNEKNALKAEIIHGLCEDDHTTNRYHIKHSVTPVNGIDTALLKKELPDIAAKYSKVSERVNLDIKEIGRQ